MNKIEKPAASAGISLRHISAFALLLAFGSISVVAGTADNNELAQRMVAYAFVASHFPQPQGTQNISSALPKDMAALHAALASSLGSDSDLLMAWPHKAVLVPYLASKEWLELQPSRPEDLLFVIEPKAERGDRVLVAFSSTAPEGTKIFWLQQRGSRYESELLYDSFKKGEISNAKNTVLGTVTAVMIEADDSVLLKELAEPGSRYGHMGDVGRIFRLRLPKGSIELVPKKDFEIRTK
jgi:hypothetical protein